MPKAILVGPNRENISIGVTIEDVVNAINAIVTLQGARASEKYPLGPESETDVR